MVFCYNHSTATTKSGRTFTICPCNEACNIADTNTCETNDFVTSKIPKQLS